MALTALKTWSADEVLTRADLNAEFGNIYDNGEDLGWPATKDKNLDGNALVLDADTDSQLSVSATDDQLDLQLQNVLLFRWNGAVASPVNAVTWTAAASGSPPVLSATSSGGADTNVDINITPLGSGTIFMNGNILPLQDDAVIATAMFGGR